MKTIIHAMGMHSRKYGGLEVFMLNLVKNFTARGYRSVLIYHSMPTIDRYVKDIEEAGGEIVICEYGGFFDTFKRLNAIMKKHQPEIVHAHFLPRIPMVVSKFRGVKKRYVTVHSLIEDNQGAVLQSPSEMPLKSRLLIALFDTIPMRYFAVSQQVEKQIRTILPDNTDITTCYLGVSQNKVSRKDARQLLGVDEDKLLLCNISFDIPFKAIDILLEGIRILKDKHHIVDFTLMHYGIDPNSDAGRKWNAVCVEKCIDQCVVWNGVVNNITQILPAMDIYVHPSRAEAIGLVNMEAGAASVPVVTSNVGGMKEVVSDGVSGLLFDVDNASELADKLKKLIDDKELRRAMGRRGQEIVGEKFDVKTQALTITRIILN